MDPLSALLDAGERTLDIQVRAPWSVDVGTGQGLTLVAVMEGVAWCHRDDGEPLLLETGDLVVLRRSGSRRVITDSPDSVPSWQRFGRAAPVIRGERGAGGARLLLRAIPTPDQSTEGFVSALAPEQVLTTARTSHLWPWLREETEHLSVATSSVITRLVDLLFIDALRRWVAEGEAEGWMRAVLDPVVGAALRLFHGAPEHPWTLEELAERLGTTRASLSRRFQLFVGEPPMTYLRRWRLTRAASLIDEGTTVASAARISGFSDPFAFSAAFSKEFGVAPGRYRGQRSAGSA